MKFARIVFIVAGVYGLLALLPRYFAIEPNNNYPIYFYGFIGVAVAWQVLFLLLARNPVRYRVMMLPGALEKISFGVAALLLYAQGRLDQGLALAGVIDLLFAALFVAAYFRTPE